MTTDREEQVLCAVLASVVLHATGLPPQRMLVSHPEVVEDVPVEEEKVLDDEAAQPAPAVVGLVALDRLDEVTALAAVHTVKQMSQSRSATRSRSEASEQTARPQARPVTVVQHAVVFFLSSRVLRAPTLW